MGWRRRLAIARLGQSDRETIVALLATKHPIGSADWWRARWWRWLMGELSATDIFTLIHAKNLWGSEESSSGVGATLAETATLRQALPALLRQLGVSSLLDIPCGDFNWMSTVDLAGIRYRGADIVADLVAENARGHAAVNGGQAREFLRLDLISDPLPRADAILCRDCLVHLPNRMALRALANIRSSGATYLLATTFPTQTANPDISMGFWRPLNLERPPFNLPPPLTLLHEGNPDPSYADKSLGVWRVADLPILTG